MSHTARFLRRGCGLLVLAQLANANPVPDRFASIVRGNAFRLSPPPPEVKRAIQPAEHALIILQGVTTILGRPQVLLNIQPSARQANARGISFILAKGESRYEVEIIEINAGQGWVRLINNGVEQTFSLK